MYPIARFSDPRPDSIVKKDMISSLGIYISMVIFTETYTYTDVAIIIAALPISGP